MPDQAPPPTPADPGPAHKRPTRVVWVVAGFVLVAGGLVASRWWADPAPPPPQGELDITAPDPLDEEPLLPGNPGYVGMDACAECHAARVATVRPGSHARACRRPEDGPMPAGFEPGRGLHATLGPGLRFEMTRTGGGFFQTAVQQTPAGEKRTTSRIDLVYGANGKADEVFFSWTDDRLYELIVVWLHPGNRWANTSYDHLGAGTFVRETTTRCVECHNTWFDHAPGTANQYHRDTAILGVTCEKCHGPGQSHVKYHRAHPRERTPEAIVRPGWLARERQIEICTQCHANATKPRWLAFSYRPGRPLEESYRFAVTRHPEEDHVANQIKYLRQSKCFQKRDTLTCVTCHDPHRPHEGAAAAASRTACLKCHTPDNCRDRPNLPAGVRDDCVSCHMPQRVWMNVHFHTSDERFVPPVRRFEHRIAVHPVARKEVLLAWHREQPTDESRREADCLMEELAGHWLEECASRRGEYRFLAAIGAAREVLLLNPPPPIRAKALAALQTASATQAKLDADWVEARHAAEAGRVPEAMATLERILTVKPDWAAVHSKLGALCAAVGRDADAVAHLEAVARYDPDNATGLAMLGWLAYLRDRPAEAVEFYRKAELIQPHDAKINYHWGLALLKLERWTEAAERFRQVVQSDPNHAGGFQGLSHTARQLGQPTEALASARRAAKLTAFQNPDILVTLADAYVVAGRPAEAAIAADKALARPGTALPPDVRRRLESLRTGTRP